MPSPRIGIYGGTFNPPHMGHLHAAKTFLDSCKLDRLYVLPTAVPPHKQVDVGDDPAHRLAMCRLAFADAGDDRITVSDHEQTRGGKSYTVLTLEYFKTVSDHLFFLCGTDMFLTLESWYRGADILRITSVCCLARGDGDEPLIAERAAYYRQQYGTEIILPKVKPLVLSSTDVRHHIAAGQPTDTMLSDAVSAYIKENHLYE